LSPPSQPELKVAQKLSFFFLERIAFLQSKHFSRQNFLFQNTKEKFGGKIFTSL
jgi:hypothetical protein